MALLALEWHQSDPAELTAFGVMLREETDWSAFFCWHPYGEFGLSDHPQLYVAFQAITPEEVPAMATIEQREKATDWSLGARWNNLPVDETRVGGKVERRAYYEYGVAIERDGDVWELPHVGPGGKFRLVPA